MAYEGGASYLLESWDRSHKQAQAVAIECKDKDDYTSTYALQAADKDATVGLTSLPIGGASGGNETRPRNVAMNYIIKY